MLSYFYKPLYFSLITFVLFISLITYFSSHNLGPYRMQSVQSGSMAPELSIGNLILIKNTASYDIGDVITIRREEANSLTHRVVDMNVNDNLISFKTKGDANKFRDTLYIEPEMIMGEMIYTVPYLGLLVDYVKTDAGLGILVVTPVVFIIFTELNIIKKELSDRKKHKIFI